MRSISLALAFAAVASILGVFPGVAIARPFPIPGTSQVEAVANLGEFAENIVQETDNTVLVTTENALYRVFLDRNQTPEVLFEAESLSGIDIHDGVVYFAVGNDVSAALRGEHAGSIRTLAVGADVVDEQPFVTGIVSPNGLVVLDDGTVLYSTVVGGFAGIRQAHPGWTEPWATVPSPNGLAEGPDGMVYVGSTLTMQIWQVDPWTRFAAPTGIFALIPDDLSVTDRGVFVASMVGVWFPGLLAVLVTPDMTGATSVKPAFDGSLLVTTRSGGVYRLNPS